MRPSMPAHQVGCAQQNQPAVDQAALEAFPDSVTRERWVRISARRAVQRKLTKLASKRSGRMAKPDNVARMTVVLTGVLVTATLTPAMQQSAARGAGTEGK